MNVPAGVYSIETVVWDQHRERPVLIGPSVTITVEEGPSFWGSVQLNPRMRLVTAAERTGAVRQRAVSGGASRG